MVCSMGKFNWKIVDTEKAKELHIEVLDGLLIIDLGSMPPGFDVPEYIKYIEDEGIVLNYDSSRYPVNKRRKKQWE